MGFPWLLLYQLWSGRGHMYRGGCCVLVLVGLSIISLQDQAFLLLKNKRGRMTWVEAGEHLKVVGPSRDARYMLQTELRVGHAR